MARRHRLVFTCRCREVVEGEVKSAARRWVARAFGGRLGEEPGWWAGRREGMTGVGYGKAKSGERRRSCAKYVIDAV